MPHADYTINADGSVTIHLTDCRDFAAKLRALAPHRGPDVRVLIANRAQSITANISLDEGAAQAISAEMVLVFHVPQAFILGVVNGATTTYISFDRSDPDKSRLAQRRGHDNPHEAHRFQTFAQAQEEALALAEDTSFPVFVMTYDASARQTSDHVEIKRPEPVILDVGARITSEDDCPAVITQDEVTGAGVVGITFE